MRSLELALLLANVPILWMCVVAKQSPIWGRSAANAVVVLMAIQMLVDGNRWQMYPAYFVVGWMFVTSNLPALPVPGFWMGLASTGFLMASAALCVVLPVFELPIPTGPFPIGTIKRHLVDSSRQELQGTRIRMPRELMIQIWYPAATRSGRRQPYCSQAEMPLKKKHLSLVRTHAAPGVPFAGTHDRYPVLIFSPSWLGGRIQNTVQAEYLASHGFVVVGIDHPYGTHKTLFPDGRVITSALGNWLDFSSESNFQASLRSVNEQLRIRTADARFVLDTLEDWDRCDPGGLLTGRLDTARAGIWGHSFGGAVAAEACHSDRRFRAGVDLDGSWFGESSESGVEQAFLVMGSDMCPPTAAELANSSGPKHQYLVFQDQDDRNIRRSMATHGGYFMTVRGASHMNFCDSALFSPLKRLTGAGSIDALRAGNITNEYTLAFFNHYLVGRTERILHGASPLYPEVRLEMWHRRQREVVTRSASQEMDSRK